jgi:MFS family permease
LTQVPRTVWALGLVSMFMDISSEMIHSLLPLFLVGTLGASASLFGLIEGIAEATASITKVFSGWLSDRLAKRKLLTAIGYGLGAITKPVFALAITPFEVLAARFVDRIGKGIRGAPRDALVADVTPQALRGVAYGLRQALDTVGAFAGPLLAIGLMVLLSIDIRAVFAWAIVPGVIAVGLLLFCVREPVDLVQQRPAMPIRIGDVRHIGTAYWGIVIIGAVFTMARFSEAFLVLRASDVGLSMSWVPLIMVVMNLTYALVAIPAGQLSDRIDRRRILVPGLLALIAADLVLALWHSIAGAFLGAALWGLHMGLTQGLLSALIADAAPLELRGTAFGVFNLICGTVLLAASTLAGILWQTAGAQVTFIAGAVFAGLALLGLAVWRPRVNFS